IVHSRSETTFIATKRVVFVPGKGFFIEPAKVTATTKTSTESIESRRGGIAGRIISRVAASEIEENRDQISAIAQERAERRIATAFDKVLQQRLDRLNSRMNLQLSLAGLFFPETSWCCSSTPRGLLVAFRGDNRPIRWSGVPVTRADHDGPIQI